MYGSPPDSDAPGSLKERTEAGRLRTVEGAGGKRERGERSGPLGRLGAAGGRGEGRPLTDRDRWIAEQVGPELVRRGLNFVGIDVIGNYLTEINVTCPTCIRELDAQFGLDIAGDLVDSLAN